MCVPAGWGWLKGTGRGLGLRGRSREGSGLVLEAECGFLVFSALDYRHPGVRIFARASAWPFRFISEEKFLFGDMMRHMLSSFLPRQRRVMGVLSPRCVRAAARRAVLSPSLYLSGSVCFL